MIQVTEGTTVIAEYAYDGFGRRVKKTVGSDVVHYHYDLNGLLISETDGSGNAIRDYVYLNGEPIAMKVYGSPDAWYYFLNDHLGTPQKLVDSAGAVVWAAGYLPFGEAQLLTADVENNLRFPGQYYDSETGLHYNWHRYYDPETGRYLRADPIGLDGGINLYGYVGNNPINTIDPKGLFLIGIGGKASGSAYIQSDTQGVLTLSINGWNPIDWQIGYSYSLVPGTGIGTGVGGWLGGTFMVAAWASKVEDLNGIGFDFGGSASLGPLVLGADVGGSLQDLIDSVKAHANGCSKDEPPATSVFGQINLGIGHEPTTPTGISGEIHVTGAFTTGAGVTPREIYNNIIDSF